MSSANGLPGILDPRGTLAASDEASCQLCDAAQRKEGVPLILGGFDKKGVRTKTFSPRSKTGGGGGSVQRWAWSFKGGQPDRKLAQSQDKRAWLMGIVLRAPERTLELKIGSSQIYKSMLRREVGVIRSNFNFRFRHGQQSAVFDAHFQRYLWQHHARTVIRATWPQGKLPSAYYRWGQRLHRARFASG